MVPVNKTTVKKLQYFEVKAIQRFSIFVYLDECGRGHQFPAGLWSGSAQNKPFSEIKKTLNFNKC